MVILTIIIFLMYRKSEHFLSSNLYNDKLVSRNQIKNLNLNNIKITNSLIHGTKINDAKLDGATLQYVDLFGNTTITGTTYNNGNFTVENGDVRFNNTINGIAKDNLALLGGKHLFINMPERSYIYLNNNDSDSEIKLGKESLTEDKLAFFK